VQDAGPGSRLNEADLPSIHGLVQTGGKVVRFRGADETSAAPESFDDLFTDQHDRLYRALYFITGSSADAEELMQDAFLRLWERWDQIQTIEDPVGYLFRVAMNGFRMRARRARMAARRAVLMETARDPFDDIELRDDVRRLLLGLPVRQRAALVLTEIFGYSSEQAAQILGIRPTTVRVLASQARAALRGR
jgi:RNA polymerase sigma-70 factor (ECF subfamily)